MALVVDCLLLKYVLICSNISVSTRVCDPACGAAVAAGRRTPPAGSRGACSARRRQQLLSASGWVRHSNCASGNPRPALQTVFTPHLSPFCIYAKGGGLIFAWGHVSLMVAFKGPSVILGVYKCSSSYTKYELDPPDWCCWEVFVLFQELLHISGSFAFFSLLLFSVDVFHVLFFPDHFFLFSISFLKLDAAQKDAAPFVWLCASHRLNLLSVWLVQLLLLLSCSILSCPNASLVLPPLLQPLGHVAFLVHVPFIDAVCTESRAPPASPLVMASRTFMLSLGYAKTLEGNI